MFHKFNKTTKLDALLYDLKFGIVLSNSKKIFEKFFTWFILTIAPLNSKDQYKISKLRRSFNE